MYLVPHLACAYRGLLLDVGSTMYFHAQLRRESAGADVMLQGERGR
jgi:hypothetical protein